VIRVTVHAGALAGRLAAIFAALSKRGARRTRMPRLRLDPARAHILPPLRRARAWSRR